ncbi:MAG: hypothetical protein OHK0039_41160 [Bacteroidia bacterium]
MPRLLVSWVAWYFDFNLAPPHLGEVSEQGPNHLLYKTGIVGGYDKHLLLSPAEEGDFRTEMLEIFLRRNYPGHKLEVRYCNLRNFIDFREIRSRVEEALHAYRDWDIGLLVSAGATPMRMTWLLLHLEDNGYRTHMLQSLDQQMSQSLKLDHPQIVPLHLEGSTMAYRLSLAYDLGKSKPSGHYIPPSLQQIYDEAARVAPIIQVPVLIQGPSGSGKERLASYIHERSGRRGSFVAVNCAAIQPDLLESRLFGYKKGAFTGAATDTKGFFHAADKGTLFLDEIGDIHPSMQVALLRVLQESVITPVGATKDEQIDVRIVAATNRDLWEDSNGGLFRQDLYYRLAGVELHLPAFNDYPPEERRAAIEHMLEKYTHLGRTQLRIDPAVWSWLLGYAFPGNFRELDMLIKQFYVYCDTRVRIEDLTRLHRHRPARYALSIAQVEEEHIRRIFAAYNRNISQSAGVLGISINTLKARLRSYGLLDGGEAHD